jgi:hypothetical protein
MYSSVCTKLNGEYFKLTFHKGMMSMHHAQAARRIKIVPSSAWHGPAPYT